MMINLRNGMSNEFQNESAVHRAALMYEVLRLFGHCAYLYGSLEQIETSLHGDLSLNDVKALELIIELEALTVGQLMQLTGLSAGGTTAVADRLEKAGFITRERHRHDRRITILRPVEEACAVFKQKRGVTLSRLIAERHQQARPYEQEQMRAFLRGSLAALKTEASRYLLDEDGGRGN